MPLLITAIPPLPVFQIRLIEIESYLTFMLQLPYFFLQHLNFI